MTGRENQFALYVRDRWNVSQKLTLSLGLRLEYYPLMTRADSGIERLDHSTYDAAAWAAAATCPRTSASTCKTLYFAPRLGAMYRLSENSVIRAGYGRTINPLPWSRPMRGSYPYDIYLNQTAEHVRLGHHARPGHPGRSRCPTSARAACRCRWASSCARPSRTTWTAAIIQQWNVAFEQRLPWDISAEIAYVGTAHRRRLRRPQHQLRRAGRRQRGAPVLRASPARPTSTTGARRTKQPLQGPAVRAQPPVPERPDAEGRLHAQPGEEHGDATRTAGSASPGTTRSKYDDNFALAGFDRTHVAQLGFLYELPFLEGLEVGARQRSWAAGRSTASAACYSGTPYSIAGTNNALNCQGCGSILINYAGDKPEPIGGVGLAHRDLLRQVACSRSRPAPTSTASAPPAQPVLPPAERVERGPVGCSRRSRSGASARRSGSRPRTCSTTRTGAPGHDVHREQLPAVHSGLGGQRQRYRVRRDQHAGTAAHPDRPASAVLGVS